MKKLVKVEEVDGEGLLGLLDKNVVIFCANYIYAGVLSGVNVTFIKLDKAQILYDTGPITFKKFTTAEDFSNPVYIQANAIEMFTERA